MIQVTVRYHGALKNLSGVHAEELALPAGSHLGDALRQLAAAHGPRLQNLLFPGGEVLSSQVIVFHNGRLISVEQPGRSALPLDQGDALLLFFATSGG